MYSLFRPSYMHCVVLGLFKASQKIPFSMIPAHVAMAINTNSSSVVSTESFLQSGSVNMIGMDNSPIQLSVHKLNGENYLECVRSIKLVIDGKKVNLFMSPAK